MGAKYDVWFEFNTDDRNLSERAAQILTDIFKNEKFTVEEYIYEDREKLEIEPKYLLMDEGDLSYLEIAAKSLSSLGVTGYINIFHCPYEMAYIRLLGNGNYLFGNYVRGSIDLSQG